MTDEVYKQYRRTQIAELADWYEGFDMFNPVPVSLSPEDIHNGSPKLGDKIARNPANHNDRWLVAKDYFEKNFEEITFDKDSNG